MKQLFVLLVWVVFVAGCSQKPVTSGVGVENMSVGQRFTRPVKLDNPDLAKKITISDIASRTKNDLLEVNLKLNSTYKKTQQLQYQFNWFDSQGFVVEPGKAPWKSLSLHGHQSINLKALAPTPAVKKFHIYIREVHSKAYKF